MGQKFYPSVAKLEYIVPPSSFRVKATITHSFVVVDENHLLPPATKLWQRNVFTPVCHSVHRGGLCPSMHHRSHDQGVPVQGRDLCPGGSLSGSGLGGVSVQGVSVQGGLCPGGLHLGDRDPHTVTSGWYASYWNAFLLETIFNCSFCTHGFQICEINKC